MEWYEAEVRALEARREPDPPGRAVAFFGTSSSELWSNLATDLGDPRIVNRKGDGLPLHIWRGEAHKPRYSRQMISHYL